LKPSENGFQMSAEGRTGAGSPEIGAAEEPIDVLGMS
jgi:hypothetical protein